MAGRALAVLSGVLLAVGCAAAQDNIDRRIASTAEREARDLLARELLGHYDILRLEVLRIEPVLPGKDYALVTVTLVFSSMRNATRHASLNAQMFDPGSPMCRDGLYLHCGVPPGHFFDGRLQLLLAADQYGAWSVVAPSLRSRKQFPLEGYLLLEGREKEGYVISPKQQMGKTK